MRWSIIFLFNFWSFILFAQTEENFRQIPLFTAGDNGYECFRIPAVITINDDAVLAFAEGRKESCSDFGDVDIVMRKSTDGGKTWSNLSVLIDNGKLQAGNPVPLVDDLDPQYKNGRVFLFYNQGTASEWDIRSGQGVRTVHYINSSDGGQTWSSPIDITKQAFPTSTNWRTYALGPGHGLQKKRSPHKGRLLIPANHSEGEPQDGFLDYRSHALYSDDHGETWHMSATVEVPSSNESIASELDDGSILLNSRHQNGSQKCRIISISHDGGETWDTSYFDTVLISPVCQASLIETKTHTDKSVLLFSNPASRTAREKLTVRLSLDNGQTWPIERIIRDGASAYSDLTVISDGQLGLLYEQGNDGGIYWVNFNLDWLVGDGDLERYPWLKKYFFKNIDPRDRYKLPPPLAQVESMIFSESTEVTFESTWPGSKIVYTTDGSTPDLHSNVYERPILVRNTAILKAKTVHPDFVNSSVVVLPLILAQKVTNISSVIMGADPNPKYQGSGTAGLFDLNVGGLQFSDKAYMGFQDSVITIDVTLENPMKIDTLSLSFLEQQGSWIFRPIDVKVNVDGQNFSVKNPIAQSDETQKIIMDFPIDKKTDHFQVTIRALSELPDWHDGKGNPGWIFIDEIIIR